MSFSRVLMASSSKSHPFTARAVYGKDAAWLVMLTIHLETALLDD